ncbi:hypothetical protein [Hafnia sp. HMSC23F03]|uniref:hypothetical protein n=1 Tax=Hafnia sp. HMSC23F03 TaxID=1581059 RepID=UPI0008A4ADA3|nr:hypothetical protein [Hafnia sp. HMSC23F03]OFS10269.1 hypothetical protein HMPREF3091_10785 [Hafnia sp. HMSC23F03]
MKQLNYSELEMVSGGVDRDAVVAAGTIGGGLLGQATRLPNGGLYGSTIGGYVAGKGYDAIANSPTINIPNIPINPAQHSLPWGKPPIPPICRTGARFYEPICNGL